MKFHDTSIAGLKTFAPASSTDARGDFTKLIHKPSFDDAGLPSSFPEHYVSTSRRGAIRGMHFQTPPHDHDKLVICLAGRVIDVVLDLRRGMGSFGSVFARELNGARRDGLFIPKGCAHGFQALIGPAILAYYVTSVYVPEHDSGVRYDSFGFHWPIREPIVSQRDESFRGFSALDNFF